MKKICICLIFCGLFLCGCMEQQKSGPQAINSTDTNRIESKFPEFLVGVWEADTFRWAFKFEPDGRISKLIHTIGMPIKVEDGVYYTENPDVNGSGLFILGPCDTSYDPNSKVLKVSVILDYLRMEIPTGVLEGSSKDLFEGPVSEKDLTWNVKWRSYSTIEGASPPDINLIDANPEGLVFRKLDLEKLNPEKKSKLK